MIRKNTCSMEVSGQVLCVKLRGVWTKNTVREVLADCQNQVQEIKHLPWAAYVDIRDWVMPSLEAMEGFQQIYDWCWANGQTHEATVCRFELQKSIIGDVSNYSEEYHFFTQESAAACNWLEEKGFPVLLPKSIE
ncbi:hypothetical protein [Flavobacterium sp. W21_SRS_FM6]|uniref:hypothetical protein n=1 Tax=Flavobacterium sp. W21_SRS_FM6 TaxID=3240268 RepID=UPI003F932B01